MDEEKKTEDAADGADAADAAGVADAADAAGVIGVADAISMDPAQPDQPEQPDQLDRPGELSLVVTALEGASAEGGPAQQPEQSDQAEQPEQTAAAQAAWDSAVAVAEAATAAKEAQAAAEAVAAEAAPAATDAETGEEGGEAAEEQEPKPKKKRFSRFRWRNMSYVSRTSLAFAFVAALTAVVAIGGISAVWGQYFQAYTKENMDTVASTAASRIALSYEEQGQLEPNAVRDIAQAAVVSPDVGIRVLNEEGDTVYETAREGATDGTSFEPTDLAQIALAKIIANDQVVGTVHIWVFGSDTLMSKLDQQFRDNSYVALAFAGVIAVVVATLFGVAFARSLMQPINRLTRTAAAVKAGKLDARSNLTGEDEIAHLGETFDSMIASVEKDRRLEQRLTSDVAHELRTPLMSIQASMEAMIDGVYETDAEHLAMVNTEVHRLSRLVDALLKLSRLENRSRPMNEKVIDLGELVGEIVQTHEQFVADSELKLGFYADNRVLVMGDSDMISQAVVNLISNAVRYTPAGGNIDVSVRRGTAMANISVKDTGIGLSQEEAKMVFSRFWRADAGRNRESGGLGIGLAVVKEIVDRHNGWIGVEGETGKGATFTIHIPLYEDTISRVRARSARERARDRR